MDISNLKDVYIEIKERMRNIDFNSLWPGFYQFDFALYNDKEVYYIDKYIPKTDEFIANTSIKYQDKYIAIWYLIEDTDIDVLTSKIVHEMFHGFQYINNEIRFPNEFEAIIKYEYSPSYLQIKYEENLLLSRLIAQGYNDDGFKRFLKYRKYRQIKYNYQYAYENGIETIEGSAQYVEMQVLKTLSMSKYLSYKEYLIERIKRINNLIPIRIISYDIGTLLLFLLIDNKLDADLQIGKTEKFFIDQYINNTGYQDLKIKITKDIQSYYDEDLEKLKQKINKIITTPKKVMNGFKTLSGFNVYSARFYENYLYTEYLLMYQENNNDVVLYGNYLVKLKDGMIEQIYEE